MAKEFVFDHSYWSVNVSDDHYADQEVVSHMSIDAVILLLYIAVFHTDKVVVLEILSL